MEQILIGLVSAAVPALLWIATWYGERRGNRRRDQERYGQLASEMVAAATMYQGSLALQANVWASRRARLRVVMAALVEILAADSRSKGLLIAARTTFAWDADGSAKAEAALIGPLTRLTSAWAQLHMAGNTELAVAADGLIQAALALSKHSAFSDKAADFDAALRNFTAIARRVAGLPKQN
ncbi:hypothetical protein [Actinopolymorpha pittospori]|uniref:Uncharacterized protein n=1 Tax=Actinopolymorpha pittospori TaxID=648752 RepID=A0A927MU37_9ACTN|nr:hypothetical protein [Actinopolymorpha pittospori]MBE1606337.1 hypothetical protein [Actinopolymorpha pittospori]